VITTHQDQERHALIVSIFATAGLSFLGILWGLAIGSQMILFDGFFGLIGIITSGLLLRASMLAAKKPSRLFPYGQQSTTPLVIGIQGFVILATLAYAAVESAITIRNGGSHFSPLVAIPYGVIAAIGSIAIAWWLRRKVKNSELIKAESTAWMIGGLRGVGMIVGFACMMLIDGSSWDAVVPFIDPAMVLLTCVIFIRPPLKMLRSTIHELLEGAAGPAVQSPVLEAIASIQSQFNLADPIIRINKVGSKLYVEVDAYAAPEMTIAVEHEIRNLLEEKLQSLPYKIWLNLDLLPITESPVRASDGQPISST
jgi:predicted Co/Zn/Cd cation transporter (cation efflux family)